MWYVLCSVVLPSLVLCMSLPDTPMGKGYQYYDQWTPPFRVTTHTLHMPYTYNVIGIWYYTYCTSDMKGGVLLPTTLWPLVTVVHVPLGACVQ